MRKPLVIAMPQLMIGITLLDRLGRTIKNYREPGHSWTRNAYNWLFACMTDACGSGTSSFGAGYMTVRQTSGTIRSTNTTTANRASATCPTTSYGMTNSAQTNTTGIVVGTDATAFNVDDYALGAIVAHGTGAGQLNYQVQSRPTIDYTSEVWKATHSRSFINGSGNAITVREVGIHYGAQVFSSTTTHQWLMARDVLENAVEVADAATLIVDYEISMSFADID